MLLGLISESFSFPCEVLGLGGTRVGLKGWVGKRRRGLTINSAMSPKDLTTEGSNVESKVLATAVKWVTEKRVLLNGHKTIVFN